MKDKQKRIDSIKELLKKVDDKDFNVYFFVIDSKGNPSGSLEYVYSVAYTFKELGYRVAMLHQEENFVGVGDWLGSKYAELPHYNIAKENVEVSNVDYLFVPEYQASILSQVKDLPCKKIGVLTNKAYLTDVMPVTATWAKFGIGDVITNTDGNKKFIETYFPGVRAWRISPCIGNAFRKQVDVLKSPVVNLCVKKPEDVKRIMKTFYWKYPLYNWVSFRDIRGFGHEKLADILNEGFLTVWSDSDTAFGYAALEALRCGSIVLGKIPDEPNDWMVSKDALTPAVVWFDNYDVVVDMIASLVRTWTLDAVPDGITASADSLNERFTADDQKNEVENIFTNNILESRKKDFHIMIAHLESVEEDKEESNEE